MAPGANGSGWVLDFGGIEEVNAAEFIWPPNFMDDPAMPCTLRLDTSRKEGNRCQSASKKRNRVTSCAEPGTKACREKMRRDRLNDRFVELCGILEPGRPPKADKGAILTDTTRRLSQLHLEANKLKQSNELLQEMIKNLKAEKLELRDEKVKLKAKKEQLDQMLKSMITTPTYAPQPVAATAHPASCNKNIAYPNYQLIGGMWQWIPPASLDTSQDHVLRSPVA